MSGLQMCVIGVRERGRDFRTSFGVSGNHFSLIGFAAREWEGLPMPISVSDTCFGYLRQIRRIYSPRRCRGSSFSFVHPLTPETVNINSRAYLIE